MYHLANFISDQKITQSSFAKMVGISDAYLSQILTGVRKPSFRIMLKISEATHDEVGLDSWIAAYSNPPNEPTE